MASEPEGSIVLTVDEVAQKLRVSRPTVVKLISGGKLKAIKVGRQYRIPAAEVERFIAGGGDA